VESFQEKAERTHMTVRNKSHKGFTLIELMIVVAIVGILAVLAVVGVRRYLSNAKTAEARNSLGAIGKGAAQALEREATTNAVVAAGSTGIVSRRLCLTATQNVPAIIPAGKKYQSNNTIGSDFHKDDGSIHTGFACIRFEMSNPQSYQYVYVSDSNASTQGENITAFAYGDLNGDTVTSMFTLSGAVQSKALVLAPSLLETNPDE
jgi:type IV pilus assembly protein PilA